MEIFIGLLNATRRNINVLNIEFRIKIQINTKIIKSGFVDSIDSWKFYWCFRVSFGAQVFKTPAFAVELMVSKNMTNKVIRLINLLLYNFFHDRY